MIGNRKDAVNQQQLVDGKHTLVLVLILRVGMVLVLALLVMDGTGVSKELNEGPVVDFLAAPAGFFFAPDVDAPPLPPPPNKASRLAFAFRL